jgi:hypothetical protein
MAVPSRQLPSPTIDGALPPCKGYQRLDTTALGASVGLTVPNNARIAIIQAEVAPVRWRADGVDPTATVGMLIADGGEILYATSEEGLEQLRFIRASAGALLNVSYY